MMQLSGEVPHDPLAARNESESDPLRATISNLEAIAEVMI